MSNLTMKPVVKYSGTALRNLNGALVQYADRSFEQFQEVNAGDKIDGSYINGGVQAPLTFDNTPTNGSSNPVTSTGIKAYADALVVGLLDDRGNYDASGNTFPTTGGSGAAGAILKGDLYFISVQGTLGGTLAQVGSSIRALVDTPGQTAGNWDALNVGIGYTPAPLNAPSFTGGITVAGQVNADSIIGKTSGTTMVIAPISGSSRGLSLLDQSQTYGVLITSSTITLTGNGLVFIDNGGGLNATTVTGVVDFSAVNSFTFPGSTVIDSGGNLATQGGNITIKNGQLFVNNAGSVAAVSLAFRGASNEGWYPVASRFAYSASGTLVFLFDANGIEVNQITELTGGVGVLFASSSGNILIKPIPNWGTPTGTLYRTALTNASTQAQFNQTVMALITDLLGRGYLHS